MKRTNPLIVVVYDGAENSVFDSQVLAPLIKHEENNPAQSIIIVSFEKKKLDTEKLYSKLPASSQITFVIRKKIPFLGKATLIFAIQSLKRILKQYPSYSLLARGPIAGLLCLQAASTSACTSLTIQARGLLAQEYAYTHSALKTGIVSWWHSFRTRQLFNLEHAAYKHSSLHETMPYTIQTVSKALSEYLITTYGAARSKITLAHHDIPDAIPAAQRLAWKEQVRTELAITHNATVYCYNGSIKAWQCPEMVIAYFMTKLQENNNALLYILTQDTQQFQALITKHALSNDQYRIIQVPHREIYRYLAAADIGLMFREPHMVNWVSRPTKILEYQAVGLAIEHNNTIAWLKD